LAKISQKIALKIIEFLRNRGDEMATLKNLFVTQVRVFKADDLPNSLSHSQSFMAIVKSEFGFIKANQAIMPITFDPSGGIVFNDGEFEFENKKYVIQQLLIESRRIIINYFGSSVSANAFYLKLYDIIKAFGINTQTPEFEPLILAQETTSTHVLSFPITKLVGKGALGIFYSGVDGHIEKYNSQLQILPSVFKFRVLYSNIPSNLQDNGVQIQEKELSIEYRAQTPIEECVYFIKSPNSSDEHEKLVAFFEKSMIEEK
jgi:hypothetical protein